MTDQKCEATTGCACGGVVFPQCTRRASVEIDGIYLCLQHAGLIAIQKLMASGQAAKLDIKKQHDPLCQISSDNARTINWVMGQK